MRVPLYPAGGTVEPQSRGPVYQNTGGAATLDAFGGGNAAAFEAGAQKLQAFANSISATAIQEAQDDIARQAKQLDIEATRRLRELNYGDGTEANPGFLSTRGEGTLNGAKDTRAAVAKIRDEVLDSNPNPRVRQLAENIVSQRAESELLTVDRHVTEQRRDFNNTVAQARIKEAASNAAANWNDPKAMEQALKTANGEILDLQRLNGWSDEVAKQKLSEARGVIVEAAVRQAVATENVETAQSILNANEKMLPAAARIELYTLLRDQSASKQGQALGDTLWARFGNDTKGALEYLQSVASGKTRDSAWQHWRQIADAANSKIQADRAALNWDREEARRVDPVVGEEAMKAWTTYQRNKIIDETDRANQERADRAVATAARDEWVQKIMVPGNAPIDMRELASDERLAKHPEWRAELVNFAASAAKDEASATVSRRTWTDLMARIHLPDGDPNKITDLQPVIKEMAAGFLNRSDFASLQTAVKEAASPEGGRLGIEMKRFLDGVKARITNTFMGDIDKLGEYNFYLFQQYVQERVNEMRKEKKDPYLLFRPSAPEFLGNPGVLAQYMRTMADQQKNLFEGINRKDGGEALGVMPRMKENDPESRLTYERLPKGARYIKPDGSIGTKQ